MGALQCMVLTVCSTVRCWLGSSAKSVWQCAALPLSPPGPATMGTVARWHRRDLCQIRRASCLWHRLRFALCLTRSMQPSVANALPFGGPPGWAVTTEAKAKATHRARVTRILIFPVQITICESNGWMAVLQIVKWEYHKPKMHQHATLARSRATRPRGSSKPATQLTQTRLACSAGVQPTCVPWHIAIV